MLLPKYALPQMRIQCSPEAMAMSRCQLLLTGLCKLHHPFAVINLSLSLSLSVSLSLSLSLLSACSSILVYCHAC
uniref:Uncharacterized protein n=1 Tax=Arundo donax TaxID=35708 RepID=A0A0A8Y1V9_ARUDO